MAATILVAHGDTHQLERMVKDLSGIGLRVIATPDGGDAFARFFEERPDAVICSEVLPVLDGRSFGRMIHSQTPDVPVIVLSAEPVGDEQEFHVLREPLQVSELLAILPELDPDIPKPTSLEESLAGAVAASAGRQTLFNTLIRYQRQGNILAMLDPPGIERLAGIAAVQDRPDEDRIIREGDTCDGFYLVLEGEVRVTLAERGDLEVARLASGEFFGEMALLSEQPRSATVWACGPTQLLFFEKEAVLPLLRDYPGLRELLGGVALQRAEENLWQALSGDDEVRDSISGLLEGLEVDEGAAAAAAAEAAAEATAEAAAEATAEAAAEATAEAAVEATAEATAEDRAPVPAEPTAPTPPVSADGEGEPAQPPVPLRPGAGRRVRRWTDGQLQMARLFFIEHQFAAGLGAGILAAVALLVVGITLWQATPRLDPVPMAPASDGTDADPLGDELGPDGLSAAGGPEAGSPGLAGGDPIAVGDPTGTGDPGPMGDETRPGDPFGPGDPGHAEPLVADVAAPVREVSQAVAASSTIAPAAPEIAGGLTRKELRRNLLAARAAGELVEAVGWGLAMAQRFELDWEAEWNLAEAAREAGASTTALQRYTIFAETHVGNIYVDDALFRAAEILRDRGKRKEARLMLQQILALSKADFRKRAEALLAELEK